MAIISPETYDVDLLDLVLADWHGEATAYHIPEHVIEDEVQVVFYRRLPPRGN